MSDQERDVPELSSPNESGAPDGALREEAPPTRKKRRRVVRPGGEKVLESEAVASYRLLDDSPRPTPKAQSGNDAALLENVPPHWGKQ